MHLVAQIACVPFGHAGDQIGGSRQGQRGREPATDRGDPAVESQRCESVIDGALGATYLGALRKLLESPALMLV